MTTVTDRAPEAPPYDRAWSLRLRATALTRLGTGQYGGAPIGDVDVYGAALAHPDLTAAQIRATVRNVGVGVTLGKREMVRRNVFLLLHGPDVAPCAGCIGHRTLAVEFVAREGMCLDANHLPATAVAS